MFNSPNVTMTIIIVIKVKLIFPPSLVSEVQLDLGFGPSKDLTVILYPDPLAFIVLPVSTTYCIAISTTSKQRPELSNIVRISREAVKRR